MATPPPGVIEDPNPDIDKIRNDIQLLDDAASLGKLHALKFVRVGQVEGEKRIWAFYCQPGLERDMNELAEFIIAESEGRDTRPLQHDVGIFLGYSPEDVRLFYDGGYASLPQLFGWAMTATHDFRKSCRVDLMLANTDCEP